MTCEVKKWDICVCIMDVRRDGVGYMCVCLV
jgi:hypothetical protein